MRRIWTITEYLPALVFFTIAGFIASRFLVAFFPGEPFSWQVFLALAPFGREIGNLIPTSTLANGALAAAGFFVGGTVCLLVARLPHWRRARFVGFHLSLLALILSMGDEKVWVASANSSELMRKYSMFPDFSALAPAVVWLFFGVICACLTTHRDLIWRLRHPVRRLA
jgi:hypothetical protein